MTDVFVVKSALSSTGTPHKMTAGLEKDDDAHKIGEVKIYLDCNIMTDLSYTPKTNKLQPLSAAVALLCSPPPPPEGVGWGAKRQSRFLNIEIHKKRHITFHYN